MSDMRRREFMVLLGGAAAAWPIAGRAQQSERMRRIGVLKGLAAGDPEAQSRVAAFESGLRELGWFKGRNLSSEYRWAGDGNVLRDHAAQLLAMAPDLILANSTPVTVALREQNPAVPIVFTQVVDPVGQGLVEPGASRRQSHRPHQLRVLDRHQMAGGAQADRAARHAGCARLQPTERPVRRPVPAAGRGCGAAVLSNADQGRRAGAR